MIKVLIAFSLLANLATLSNAAAAGTTTPSKRQAEVGVEATADFGKPGKGKPLGANKRSWDESKKLAQNFISKLTLEEKVSLATGVGWMHGPCVGNIAALPKHDFPGLCLQDAPLGIRFGDFNSVFPSGINAAATFDRKLIRARGVALGEEFRGKGINVALGPMMNMGRIAQGGRNFEGFGADPYFAGEASYETIVGMQSTGVQACAKHYVNNEQELNRDTGSSNVDDRTQHEIYYAPFLRSVQAGVASVMCSYNKINGTYACENSEALGALKNEMGFDGYVMSDWWATHTTLSANTGLDMTMPGDLGWNDGTIPFASYFGGNLTAAVNNGSVTKARVDDMATRIMAAWYLVGQDDKRFPTTNLDSWKITGPGSVNQHVDVQGEHGELIRKIGAASTILLKNTKNALPLKKPRSIALIGSDAGPALKGPNGYADRGGLDGTLGTGWGSGTSNYPYFITPLEAIQARARKDRTSVNWFLDDFDTNGAVAATAGSDVALVFIASDSGEAYITVDGNVGDKNNLTAWHNGDNLVNAVAANHPNTVVIVHTTGPIVVEPWVENPNVTAVVWAGVPGQEAGSALADVLYGDWNPSAKLPYTIAKQVSDYPVQPEPSLNVNYTEGLFIDYRHFDKKNIEPRFPFGFGLSYTKFEFSDLDVSNAKGGSSKEADLWAKGEVGSRGNASSLADWLHEKVFTVTVRVKNTGSVFGAEKPQLYLSPPASANSPNALLKGFDTVSLGPGESKRVTFELSRYDLSVWSVEKQGWVATQGTTNLFVGSHSRDKKLTGKIQIGAGGY